MEKRYQVFISSTFQDLQNARQEVSQALLRADCFPAGMELFPAADEEQFEFIKKIIDQSDYYILISAGRYGSIHPETGLSYTEMEYDYAVETGKPIIRLLHKDPFNELKGQFIERTVKAKKSLEKFRAKLTRASLVKFWEEPTQLGLLVTQALLHFIKSKPAVGWVRGDSFQAKEIAAPKVTQTALHKISLGGSAFELGTLSALEFNNLMEPSSEVGERLILDPFDPSRFQHSKYRIRIGHFRTPEETEWQNSKFISIPSKGLVEARSDTFFEMPFFLEATLGVTAEILIAHPALFIQHSLSIDPNFNGYVSFTLCNHGTEDIKIDSYLPIITAKFSRL
jgi:hypothetical protein